MIAKLSWVLYIVGFALVVGSWFNVVSATLGWTGFVLGMAGWGMQFLPGYRKERTTDELTRLAHLHGLGQLSDEEFDAAKQKALVE
jgi:uncharacterized membrane protein